MSQSQPFDITITRAWEPPADAPSWVGTTLLNRYQWYAVGTSVLDDVASWRLIPGCTGEVGTYQWSGNNTTDGIFNNWNSGVWASRFGSHGSWMIIGGGHNSYYGNDAYAWDAGSATWRRLSNPYQDTFDEFTENGLWPDGTPRNPHTWSYAEYDPIGNFWLCVHRGRGTGIGGDIPAWPILFDLSQVDLGDPAGNAARCWDVDIQRLSEVLSSTSYAEACSRWVPIGDDGVIVHQTSRGVPLIWYNRDSQTWTKGAANTTAYGGPLGAPPAALGYCAGLHALVLFCARYSPTHPNSMSTGCVKVWNLSGFDPAVASSMPAPVVVPVDPTGSPRHFSSDVVGGIGQGQCMEWSVALNAFIIARRDSYLWVLHPPADGSLVGSATYPWTWSALPRTGSLPPNQKDPEIGYYDKLRVARWGTTEVALLATRRNQPMYAMRLSE